MGFPVMAEIRMKFFCRTLNQTRPLEAENNFQGLQQVFMNYVQVCRSERSPRPPSPVGPISCISWLWLMFPSRFCRPPSPPSADNSWPPPPLPDAPGMGGLFRYSLTFLQYSSSLSVFGS